MIKRINGDIGDSMAGKMRDEVTAKKTGDGAESSIKGTMAGNQAAMSDRVLAKEDVRDNLHTANSLRITEIFYSIQGESILSGIPTVFIRFTGCPLRCRYCDSAYAFSGGERAGIEAVLEKTAAFGARWVTVTGGEPLAQKACIVLLRRLCDAHYGVSLETAGSMDISLVDERVMVVMDLKTPGSGEAAKNRYENIALLKNTDQVKFVICDEEDYRWATQKMNEYQLTQCCQVLFSVSYGELELKQLAEWILRDRLPVRLQAQLHKFIWGDEPGR